MVWPSVTIVRLVERSGFKMWMATNRLSLRVPSVSPKITGLNEWLAHFDPLVASSGAARRQLLSGA